MSDADKIVTLESLVEEGRLLLEDDRDAVHSHSRFIDWDRAVATWLDQKAPSTGLSAEWSSIGTSTLVVARRYDESHEAWQAFRQLVQRRMAWLAKLAPAAQLRRAPLGPEKRPVLPGGKVFVVHGHDEAPREGVARFLEKLRLTPVILHEQANKGRTIIEKLLDYSDVTFAVVLLTKDDQGGSAAGGSAELRPRARQNVILELGFFVGALGRDRVCLLYEDGVEIPSDYQGVVFLKLDSEGAWRLLLARELKEAGLPIDLNDAI